MPETPPGGYLFRLQDVEKQRERRKTKAKRAKNTHLCFFLAIFYYKIGENEIFG